MICYKKTAGRAHDIRFVDDDYVAGPGETVIAGSLLPSAESLSDAPTFATLAALATAEAKLMRVRLFARFDGLQASALTTGNSAQAIEIEGVKASLRNMTTDVNLAGLTSLDEMRAAFLARWNAIRAPLSGALKLAFAALDS